MQNLDVKKTPMYYLKLQEKYNKNKFNNKVIDQIAEDIIGNIVGNYRSVCFCCIKYILSNGIYNKQKLLNEFKMMYQKEKLEEVKVNFKIYELQINKFLNVEEIKRKEIIEDVCSQIQNVEWNLVDNSQEYMNEIIDKKTRMIIQDTENIYIEWKYNSNRTRILYLYEEGLVLAFDIKNEEIESSCIKIKKEKYKFIEKIILSEIEKQELNVKNNIIMINNQVFDYDEALFHIILFLCTESKKLDEKILFQYELYFSELEHRMMKSDEKKDRYLFVTWYPNKNESDDIIRKCFSIIQNIELDFQKLSLLDLKYYAQYFYKKQIYSKAILFYERLAQLGVDLAYYELYRIYKEQKEDQKAKLYEEKCTKFLSIYKKLTEKECYKIIIDDESTPNIKDSKMYGNPYLPLGESYPMTKDGKPLNLIIQINLEEIELQGFPSHGILEVFADANSRKPEYEIRYYEDTSLDYQTTFPKVENLKYSIIDKVNVKIKFEKEYTYMPIVNSNCKSMIKKAIGLYNDSIGEKIYNYNNELDCDLIYDLISKIDLYPMIIGGYADYANTDYYANEKRESLIKLMSNTGSDKTSINVLITKKDLEDYKFEKAILLFED